MKKWIDLVYDIGQEVYLKTDSDQRKRIVTSIHLKPTGISYELSQGCGTSWHFDFEISTEIDVVVKIKDND